MDERASGLVLRTRPLTETSLIVHWLTPDLGRLATVAKGARRAKSPFRGKLDLFYHADFTFVRSRRSDLHLLREVALRETHAVLRRQLTALQQAAYATALIEQTTETETPLPVVFELLNGLLGQLDRRPPQPPMVLAFEAKLLAELGLEPLADEPLLSAGSRQCLAHLARYDWDAIARLLPSPAQTAELSRFLQGFLVYHLGRVPPQRNAALSTGSPDPPVAGNCGNWPSSDRGPTIPEGPVPSVP
jgi:DNA repair protein RecO (recombination protein O)